MKYRKKSFPRFTPGYIGAREKKLRLSNVCVLYRGWRGAEGHWLRMRPGAAVAGMRGVSTIAALSSSGNLMKPDVDDQRSSPSLLQVLGSVLASMFGVQSNRKREQDFVHGKPSQYIVIGLVVTLVFILVVWGVVNLVMKLAGI